MRIHKEGPPSIILVISFAVTLNLLTWFFTSGTSLSWLLIITGLLGIFLIGIILNFFRNPVVPIVQDSTMVIAPCDGKVVVIEQIHDERYFKEKMWQVSIFMSPLNVHVNRNPIGGKVEFAQYYPGKYLMAYNPKSSHENEQTYIVISNGRVAVGFKQIAGFLARRLCWYIKTGDQVEQSQEMGFIKFGSRIDLILPLSTKINVQLGDVVKGGVTKIATV